MNKQDRFSPPLVGTSSLLVIFAALALTTFALLSLSTVRASGRLGDAAARAVTGYYQADCQAEEILARLRTGEIPPGVTVEDGLCTYTCPISGTQELAVEVRMERDHYTILRWQAVSTADWSAEEHIEVWGGIP